MGPTYIINFGWDQFGGHLVPLIGGSVDSMEDSADNTPDVIRPDLLPIVHIIVDSSTVYVKFVTLHVDMLQVAGLHFY